ncbi:serine proteinase stubble-like isoform X2 [Palaemon carinicauda]|uniref:serine proteinase stubble-like isoform X2 n=1 Tax=Palaemon carinicauda TaxID=392227 RepID=UPI0035B5A522
MESTPLSLALLLLSLWCVNAVPAWNGTTPHKEPRLGDPSSTPHKDPRLGEMKRVFDELRQMSGGDRQASSLPCGSHVLAPGQTVTIQSQNYPRWYPLGSSCLWTFEGSSVDSTISITCDDFRLRRCRLSSVLITGDGLYAKYCRTQSPFTETSGNNFMEVKFRSFLRRYYGFSCTVTASGTSTSSSTTTTTTAPTTTTTTTTAPTTTTPSGRCLCGRRNPVVRIVGGQPTTVHEYPWQVGLTSATSSTPYCGGSIISNEWILTASHCVDGDSESSVYVVVGEHDYTTLTETTVRQKIQASRIIMHPSYDRFTLDNDMALIKLSSPLSFPSDNKIAPVCLPDAGNAYSDVTATVTGWGRLQSGGSRPNVLYEVDVPTMTNSRCQQFLSGITSNMICAGLDAGGKDSCQGDSGGPMVTTGNTAQTFMVVIGVVSWGYGCADANSPGVYARVGNYLSWISTNIAGSQTCPRP